MSSISTPPSFDDAALRARFAAIVDSSDDAIVGKTLEGVITSWNRGAQDIFGFSAAEAVWQHIFLIIPEDRRAEEEEVLARLRRGEKVDHFETVRQTKDGRRITISLTVSPIRDATGRIVGASKVARDITERVTAQDAIRRAQLYARLALAQENERRRLARELHDQLGQHVTALRMTLETLSALARDRPELAGQVHALQDLAEQIDADLAFRVWELRPAVLEARGLGAALTEYVRTWSKRFGIDARLHVTPPAAEAPSLDTATAIYRLAQEALHNVVKHARGTRVDIVLERTHDSVSLIVEDDGVGFDPSLMDGGTQGFGLIGMRERAALAGGTVQIESAVNRGTTIIARLPLQTAAGAESELKR
ncbi:MAG TPA: PAS domain S-box protein [Vicinamibacterales bacterium]|nr:PAS domain S-box protein [Vicinamibacterales bacterium]